MPPKMGSLQYLTDGRLRCVSVVGLHINVLKILNRQLRCGSVMTCLGDHLSVEGLLNG